MPGFVAEIPRQNPHPNMIPCGCGDYGIRIDDRDNIRSLDVICPECGNHFGWEVPEDEFREAQDAE